MNIYKQSVIENELKYINGCFDYGIKSFSGESYADKQNFNAKSCENFFDTNNIMSEFNHCLFSDAQKMLLSIREDLIKYNIDFSAYIKIHNEHVKINNNIEDFRKYGFIRLIFKDNYNDTYLNEFSIINNSFKSLENKIKSSIIKNKLIVANKNNRFRKLKIESIPVILSPAAAGYFIHEVLGHLVEEYMYPYCKNILSKFRAPEKLTVVDTVDCFCDVIGLNKYDDVGIEIKPLTLVKEGSINNIIAIEETNSFDNLLYGMSRRESYRFRPIPRMRGTFIQPFDNLNQKEIIAKYKSAIYIDRAYGGIVTPALGTYKIMGDGFIVKDGETTDVISKINLIGNLIDAFNKIDFIGNDFDFVTSECFTCGQIVRVCMGGPTISILDVAVEGEVYEKS